MTKALPATCLAGVVTCEGVPVTTAEILSEGEGQSEGVLLTEGPDQFYLTSSASDLKLTIEKTIAALNHVVTGLTAAGGALDGLSGGAGTPVTAAASMITPIVTELTLLKETLK
jgi:hypothetical protein